MIGEYETHPIADVHRLLEGDEFVALVADIREHGLRDPICTVRVDGEDLILDGRNRLRACLELGIAPTFRRYSGKHDLASLLAYSLSVNERRRHDSESQRAMAADRAKPFYEAAAKERQRAGGAKGGKAPRGKVGANLPQPSDGERGPKARDEAARAYNVGSRSVSHASVVRAHGVPDLVRAVDNDVIAVSGASSLARHDHETQRAAVHKIVTGEAANVPQALRQLEDERRAATPAVERGNCQILTGDALEILRASDWRPHCVITDPPYGLDTHRTRHGGQDYADGERYALRLLADLSALLAARLDPSAHLYVFSGYSYAHAFKQILAAHFEVQDNPIVWVKDNHTMCDFAAWYPSKHEYVWFAKARGSTRKLAACVPDVLSCPRARDTTHSAEKPVALLETFVQQSTLPGELVYDPFTGSGSTPRAAVGLGRHFVGSELNERWAQVARVRASEEAA